MVQTDRGLMTRPAAVWRISLGFPVHRRVTVQVLEALAGAASVSSRGGLGKRYAARFLPPGGVGAQTTKSGTLCAKKLAIPPRG